MMADFYFAPEPEKKEPEPPKPKKAPKKIDHGKIIACHRAGWSITKIADEIGCSEQTVRNHIEKEKP